MQSNLVKLGGTEGRARRFIRLPSRRKLSHMGVSYVFLLLMTGITIVPFLWTASTSLKGVDEAIFTIPPQFIPDNLTLANYATVWQSLPIPTYLWNSVILAFWGVLLPLFFSSLAAFPLARMRFRGKTFVFMAILATMMIPGEVTMIPVYLILQKLQLLGSYAGIILPGAVSTLGIFLMRQAFIAIPKDIDESAIIDGANPWQVWLRILLPMVKPMLATLGILSFIGSWNNFLWPLLVLEEKLKYPLTLGLYDLQGAFVTNTRLVAAGAMIALVPIIIVFILFQKQFIQSAYNSAVKG